MWVTTILRVCNHNSDFSPTGPRTGAVSRLHMPPAAAAEEEEEDSLPSSDDDDDVEAAKQPPPGKASGTKKEGVKEPLLADDKGGKQAASDESERPKTPREKFREKSVTTPRDKAGAPSAAPSAAEAALQDPAAAAAAALKDVKAPTKEELEAGAAAGKEEAKQALEAAKGLLKDMMADAPPPITKLPEAKRMEAYIDSLAEQAEGKGPSTIMTMLKPCLMMAIRICMAISPWVNFIGKWAGIVWDLLPKNLVTMIFGGCLCYFGGTFTASIAAVEAFRTMGYEKAKGDLASVAAQVDKVKEMNAQDDAVDDDGDGVADVEQISPAELVRRKMFLVMCASPRSSPVGHRWTCAPAALPLSRADDR